MVKERRGFQKVYDLTENILPDHIDTSKPTPLETGTYYVQRMLGALGIATSSDIGYARPTIRRFAKINIIPSIEQALQALKETGDVMEFTINNRPPLCTHTFDRKSTEPNRTKACGHSIALRQLGYQ